MLLRQGIKLFTVKIKEDFCESFEKFEFNLFRVPLLDYI